MIYTIYLKDSGWAKHLRSIKPQRLILETRTKSIGMTSINRVNYSPDELAAIYLVEANRNKPTHTHSPNEIASLMPFISRYLETLEENTAFSDTEVFVRYCNTMLGFAIASSTLIKNPVQELEKFCEDKLTMNFDSSKPKTSIKHQIPQTADKIPQTIKLSTKVLPKKLQDIITDKAKKKLISKVKKPTTLKSITLKKKAIKLLTKTRKEEEGALRMTTIPKLDERVKALELACFPWYEAKFDDSTPGVPNMKSSAEFIEYCTPSKWLLIQDDEYTTRELAMMYFGNISADNILKSSANDLYVITKFVESYLENTKVRKFPTI